MSSYGYGSPSQPSVPSSPSSPSTPSTPSSPTPISPTTPSSPSVPPAPTIPPTSYDPIQPNTTPQRSAPEEPKTVTLRQYSDGEPYHPNLPGAYAPANSGGLPRGQGCYNCSFYNVAPGSTGLGGNCTRWNAPVRSNHWCAAWKGQDAVTPPPRKDTSSGPSIPEFRLKDTKGNFLIYEKGSLVIYDQSIYQVSKRVYGRLPSDENYFRPLNKKFVTSYNGLTGDVEGVSSFNGLTGDLQGVSSWNGSTGAVTFDDYVTSVNGLTGAITSVALTTQTVSSFNGSTGAIQGVSSFNGLTGAVNTSGLNLHVAGISSDGGITLGSFISIPDTFDIVNDDNNSLFEVSSGRNVRIGDVDSFGNGNNILVRDSHDQINITSSTINLSASVVNIQEKLRHTSDINTHLAFPANDEITLTTNGVTLAHLTDTFALQQGLSLDAAGITFPDGTHQTTAGGVSSVNGVTGAVNLSPGFEYVFDSDASASPAAGKFDTYTLTDDFISIHETTNDGITLDAYFDELADRGGDLVIMKDDGTEVLVVKDIGQFGVASDVRTLQLTDTAFPHAADPVAIINTEFSDGDVAYLRFDLYPPKTKYVASFNGSTGAVQGVGSISGQTGDVHISDSYIIFIETPTDNKDYTIDPRAVVGRTVTEFFAKTSSGGCTLQLKNSSTSNTIGTLVGVSASGSTASLSNKLISATNKIVIGVTGNSSAADLEISVGYTQ